MLKFEWNALRIEDKVLVHDRTVTDLALVSGVVAMVNTRKDANGVGIRVAANGGGQVIVWPARNAVHFDPPDLSERCWQCQSSATPAAPRSDWFARDVGRRVDDAEKATP